MDIRNEVKSYIVREGMTMTALLEKLAEQSGWSAGVPDLSGKLRRGSLSDQEAVELARRLQGKPPVDFPQETAVGALALYISNETVGDFQPMNVNFGIIPPLGYKVKGKRNKNAELSRRSLEILAGLDAAEL